MIKVSVIISARDEFPNIVHTVHAIVNDLETFLKHDEFEIIIADNGSKNPDSWRFLMERGMYFHRTVKVLFDPIMGNVTSRNKAVRQVAQGKWVFFSDAHMSYRIGSFKAMVETLEKHGGIVHPAVQWMGGYEPSDPSYQYTIKLGEKIWGTWNRSLVSASQSFYIPVCGHCCLGFSREEFLKFGGYSDYFRCYGGGELYLDLKWWMMGSTVMSVPTAVAYHLSAGRGYSFKQDDLIHNMMLMAISLGADAMAERVYIRYLNKVGINKPALDRLYADAKKEAQLDRTVLLAKMPFYDVIVSRPWDSANIAAHGVAASLLGVYDSSWTGELQGEARQLFDSSPLQAELSKLISSKLSKSVYKGDAE